MIGAASTVVALKASLSEPLDVRLTRAGKAIVGVEKKQIKAVDRLVRALIQLLVSVKRDPAVTPEQNDIVTDYRARIDRFDPRRIEKEIVTNALIEACNRNDTGEVVDEGTGDTWDSPPPLPFDEQFRLVDIERRCSQFVRGETVLRPGTDTRKMLEDAIDGREFSVPTLLKLYGHMMQSFRAGGCAFGSGALFSELERVLTESGALPVKEPNEKTYSEKLFEELQARA